MTEKRIPNVMVLIGNFRNNSGGAQRAIANQIQNSAGDRCRYFVCHLFGEGTLADELPDHASVVPLNAVHALDLRIFSRLRRLYRKHSIDVVHTQSPIAGYWGRISTVGMKSIKVISTEQNTHQRYRNFTGLMNGVTLPLANHIVCVSDSTRDSFFGWENWLLKRRETLTIHNAVDTAHYAGLKRDGSPALRAELGVADDDLVMGNIARLDSQKNQHHMIREFASVASEFPKAKILLIGRGALKDSLQSLIDQLGVGEQVRLVGPRTDMDDVYRMLDIFLLPSTHEGFSVALLEGMACGLPVVCSDIPQITEATAEAAITADPHRSGELAAGMRKMLADETLRLKYSQAAKERASTLFDAKSMTDRYETMYTS